jgi:hypothetical protein
MTSFRWKLSALALGCSKEKRKITPSNSEFHHITDRGRWSMTSFTIEGHSTHVVSPYSPFKDGRPTAKAEK